MAGTDQLECKLKFVITTHDGSVEEQEIPSPPDEKEMIRRIHAMMTQYSSIGVLRKDGTTWRLGPLPHSIKSVAVDMPSILLADLNQMSRLVHP